MEPEQFFGNYNNEDIIHFSKNVINNTLTSKCTLLWGIETNGKSTLVQLLLTLATQNGYNCITILPHMMVQQHVINRLTENKYDFIFIENCPDNDNYIKGICDYANTIKSKIIFISNMNISHNMAPGSISVIKMDTVISVDVNFSVFHLLNTLTSYHDYLS